LPHSQSFKSKDHTQSHPSGDVRDFSAGASKRSHPEFERLFEIWPNEEKQHSKALGAWINYVVRREVDPAMVLKRAESWCAFWREEGETFIPFLGKWIAERSWSEKPPTSTFERQAKYERQRFTRDDRYHLDDPDAED
jgi:hypothetical protein